MKNIYYLFGFETSFIIFACFFEIFRLMKIKKSKRVSKKKHAQMLNILYSCLIGTPLIDTFSDFLSNFRKNTAKNTGFFSRQIVSIRV